MSDLIVLRVDHPSPRSNQGFYRVGTNLDANGNVTGVWGPGSRFPTGVQMRIRVRAWQWRTSVRRAWVSWFSGPNKGLFRIGSKIDAQGNITGGMWVSRVSGM